MVRREADRRRLAVAGRRLSACCASPAGESPAPVSIGAPDSRPQVSEGDLHARAGCQKPVRRRESCSGEQARGPQHEVKPAASTHLQSGGRAAHVTAKATSTTRAPKRVADSGGVWGAARVQGEVRNTGDPSVQPRSRQGDSYKSRTKSSAVQRESEGIVVPPSEARAERTNAVKNNAAGGKGPWGGHVDGAGKREGMAGKTGPNDPGGRRPRDKVRELQRRLWAAAKRAPGRRLHASKLWRSDALHEVWKRQLSGGSLLATGGRVMLRSERPPVSRVREIRMHGLNGGPALSLFWGF